MNQRSLLRIAPPARLHPRVGWGARKLAAHAFALAELVVMIAVAAALAALLLPAIAHARGHSGSVRCLSNLKQLQLCWLLYVKDHHDRLPPNESDFVRGAWRSSPDSWIGGSSAIYDADTKAIEQGLLFQYDFTRSLALYRCPADTSKVRDLQEEELPMLRTRSYSMSGCFGGRSSEVQRVFRGLSEVDRPGGYFVFVDEHEDSIDDAHFLTWPSPDDRWVNMPTDRHDRSGVFSLADGHAELWKWQWPKTFRDKKQYWKKAENSLDLADLQRLQRAIPTPAQMTSHP